jgi:hypothetical protein
MGCRRLIQAMEVAAVLVTVAGIAHAGEAKYPDWGGAWQRWYPPNWVLDPYNGTRTAGGQPSFDQSKPWAKGQEAPLTPEYEKIYEQNLADQAEGGEGLFFNHGVRCMPGGMPITTIAFAPMEFVPTQKVTYILTSNQEPIRRIYTDGRDFPTDLTPTWSGYSIGRWVDQDADGTYQVLEAETRGPFKGPRTYDASGIPLHFDGQSIFMERFYRDGADPRLMHDVITVIDHALTRPWTVDKKYTLIANHRWTESTCIETNSMIAIGHESYYTSADGETIMPVRKGQRPPDMRYFKDGPK